MPKLSEMPTRNAAALIGELSVPLGNLAQHPEIQAFFNQHQSAEMNASMALAGLVRLLPAFLRDNYADTVQVLSILTGKPADAIGDQSIAATIADVKACADGELTGLFTSSAKRARAK